MARLKGWLDQILNQAEAGEYGDPLSSLCHELGKENGTPPAQAIAELMQEIIAWVQKQLEFFVKASDQSHDLATHFIAQIQGCLLYTSPSPRDA